MSDDDKIKTLPVKRKATPEEHGLMLVGKDLRTCRHQSFVVDETLDHVKCEACHERLNPMWVLKQLMQAESRWQRTREAYQQEMKRLNERKRTKCHACGYMTPISPR